MKKGDVYELNTIFTQLKNFGNTKFKYFVLKNIEILKPHVAALVEVEKSVKEELSSFEQGRNELIMKLGTQNNDGSVSIDPNNSEVFNEFNQEMENLITEHQTSIDSYNKKFADFQTILEEELEEPLVFRKLNIDEFPDSDISSEALEKLITLEIIS